MKWTYPANGLPLSSKTQDEAQARVEPSIYPEVAITIKSASTPSPPVFKLAATVASLHWSYPIVNFP